MDDLFVLLARTRAVVEAQQAARNAPLLALMLDEPPAQLWWPGTVLGWAGAGAGGRGRWSRAVRVDRAGRWTSGRIASNGRYRRAGWLAAARSARYGSTSGGPGRSARGHRAGAGTCPGASSPARARPLR